MQFCQIFPWLESRWESPYLKFVICKSSFGKKDRRHFSSFLTYLSSFHTVTKIFTAAKFSSLIGHSQLLHLPRKETSRWLSTQQNSNESNNYLHPIGYRTIARAAIGYRTITRNTIGQLVINYSCERARKRSAITHRRFGLTTCSFIAKMGKKLVIRKRNRPIRTQHIQVHKLEQCNAPSSKFWNIRREIRTKSFVSKYAT